MLYPRGGYWLDCGDKRAGIVGHRGINDGIAADCFQEDRVRVDSGGIHCLSGGIHCLTEGYRWLGRNRYPCRAYCGRKRAYHRRRRISRCGEFNSTGGIIFRNRVTGGILRTGAHIQIVGGIRAQYAVRQ